MFGTVSVTDDGSPELTLRNDWVINSPRQAEGPAVGSIIRKVQGTPLPGGTAPVTTLVQRFTNALAPMPGATSSRQLRTGASHRRLAAAAHSSSASPTPLCSA